MAIYLELFFIVAVGGYILIKTFLSLSKDIKPKTSSEKALSALADEVSHESIRLVRADWFVGKKVYSRQGGYTQVKELQMKSLNSTEGWDNFEVQRAEGFKDLDKVIFLTFKGALKRKDMFQRERDKILKNVESAFPDYSIRVVGSTYFERGGHIYYEE